MGSAVSAVGGLLGQGINGITSGILPGAQVADQSRLNNQIDKVNSNSAAYNDTYGKLQNEAGNQLDNTQNYIKYANNAIGLAQGANQNVNGDALSILRNAATGGAPSAAQAQLQSGKDQAIATQQAMANSGNLSQMIGGQKTAMDNAANLTQQAANQSAQLRANEMATARGQYGSQATGYAAQAGTNAGLANNLANTNAQLYGTELQSAQGFAGLGNQAAMGAGTLAGQGASLAQTAQNQAQQQQAGANTGMLNGIGGAIAAGASLFSDERLKKNIQDDSGDGILDHIIEFVSGKKKKPKTEERDPAWHDPSPYQEHPIDQIRREMGAGKYVEDRDEEAKLTSDENRKDNIQSDRASRSKGVSDFFRDENKKPEPKKEEDKPADKPKDFEGGYSDDDPRKKFAKGISSSFMSSDENGKEDIKKDSLIHAFLDKLNPVTFDYKETDGQMGRTPGKHMGVLAQDVEQAPGGASMVKDTPEGKAIDLASAVGMLMSAAADSHDRVSSLEELFKAKKKVK